jgi:hypothetical protein
MMMMEAVGESIESIFHFFLRSLSRKDFFLSELSSPRSQRNTKLRWKSITENDEILMEFFCFFAPHHRPHSPISSRARCLFLFAPKTCAPTGTHETITRRHIFLFLLSTAAGGQVSGLAMLCSGIWVQIGLHRYMELSTDYTNTFQIVLVGLGLIILFVGTLACCCTVKAQSSLLYLVSNSPNVHGQRINYGTFIPDSTVRRLPDDYLSHRTRYRRQPLHVQGPPRRWLTERIKSEHPKLRAGLRYEVSGFRCDAGECKLWIMKHMEQFFSFYRNFSKRAGCKKRARWWP